MLQISGAIIVHSLEGEAFYFEFSALDQGSSALLIGSDAWFMASFYATNPLGSVVRKCLKKSYAARTRMEFHG